MAPLKYRPVLLFLLMAIPAFADDRCIRDLEEMVSTPSTLNVVEAGDVPSLQQGPGPLIVDEPLSAYRFKNVTLKSFAQDLGRNYSGLFSENNIAPLLLGLSLTGTAKSLDGSVQGYFSQRNTFTLFSNTGATLGKPYVLAPAIGGLFVAGLYSGNDRFRSFSYALTQGYVLSTTISMGLKQATGRQRPDGSNDSSFPSGHSSDAFMIATVVDQYYGHKAGIVAYGVAGLVAASRVKRDVHWLSDVAAGATLGYIIGKTVTRNMRGFGLTDRISFAPAVNPLQKQYGVSFSIELP